MKNLKKVLAFTLALAMVLSTMTTTFAANETVDKLSNLGLLLNTSEQEVNAELTRSVGLAMVLKTLGYTQEDSNVKAAENTFIDMGLAEWAKGFAVIGEELKITNGISVEPKMFAPNQKLDKKSFVTFMLRALGYDTNTAWEKAASLAQEAKLVEEQTLEDANFTKGEAAMIMYNALKATVQEDAQKRSLAQKLVDEGKLNKDVAIANGVIDGVAATLEVVEVSATNLREVNVVFNTKVDKASAEKASNYKLKGKAVASAEVQEDGKTVVLTLEDALANKKETKLTVVGVKTEGGSVIAKTEKLFTPFDNQYPKVEKITFTGPKNLSIQFSEPIKKSYRGIDKNPTVTLKSGNRTYSAKVDETKGNMAYVTAYTSFKSGAEYLVAIGDPKQNDRYFFDYANYPNIYYEETLTYEKDTTAPEAEVKNANQKVVKVKFNKPVSGLSKEHFYHSFSAYKALDLYTDSKLTEKLTSESTQVSEVYVQFYKDSYAKGTQAEKDMNHALPAGEVTFTILGKVGSSEIKDAWGNKFSTTSTTLNIVADREAPEVVSIDVTGEDKVEVTFNESVSNVGQNESAIFTLTDSNGSVVRSNVEIDRTVKKGGKVVELNFRKSYAGKTMILSIKGVKDSSLYENVMADYSSEVVFTDKTLKKIDDKIKFVVDTKEKSRYLYVIFGEDMGESAIDIKNYKLKVDGKEAWNIQGDADFFSGNNSVVKIDLTYDEGKSTDTDTKYLTGNNNAGNTNLLAGATLLLSQNIKDIAGNEWDQFQDSKPIEFFNIDIPIPSAKALDSAKATARDRIEVKFKEPMEVIDGKEFEINGYSIGSYNQIDSKTLELFLTNDNANKLLGTFVDPNSVKVKFVGNGTDSNTRDIFKRTLTANDEVKVNDYIAPAIAKLNIVKTSGYAHLKNAFKTTNQFELSDTSDNSKYNDKAAIIGMLNKSNSKQYLIKVGYTENIKTNSVSTTTYELNNSDYRIVSTDSGNDNTNVITITVEKNDKKAITLDDLRTLKGLTINQRGVVRDVSEQQNPYSGAGFLSVFQVEPGEVEEPVAKSDMGLMKFSEKADATEATSIEDAFNSLKKDETVKKVKAEFGITKSDDAVIVVKDSDKYKIKLAYKKEVQDGLSTNYFSISGTDNGFTIESVAKDKNIVILTLKAPSLDLPLNINAFDNFKVKQTKEIKTADDKRLAEEGEYTIQNKKEAFKDLFVFERFTTNSQIETFANALDDAKYGVKNAEVVGKPVAVIKKEGSQYFLYLVYTKDMVGASGTATDKYTLSEANNITIKASTDIVSEGNKVKIELENVKDNWVDAKGKIKVTQKAEVNGVKAMTKAIDVFGDDTLSE